MEHISRDCFEALQRGDDQACATTFRHYQRFARHVARRCGVDEVNTDDVVQIAFLKLYQHASKLEAPGSIAQWLAVTIRNLCLDEYRKNTRSQRNVGAFAAQQNSLVVEESEPTDEDLLEGRIYAETIRTIEKTPGGETLKAFYLDGMSVEEIARQNREAVGTVTARLSRMRKKLRDILLKKISNWEEEAS